MKSLIFLVLLQRHYQGKVLFVVEMKLISGPQITPYPSEKRKPQPSNEKKSLRGRGVLTPGSSPYSFGPSPRPQASGKFQRLFPSSPMDQISVSEVSPDVIEIKDASMLRTLKKESPDKTSAYEVSDSNSIEYANVKGEKGDFVGLRMTDVQVIVDKISLYVRHLHSHAKKKGRERKVMKYSRKLKRLTERIPRYVRKASCTFTEC